MDAAVPQYSLANPLAKAPSAPPAHRTPAGVYDEALELLSLIHISEPTRPY